MARLLLLRHGQSTWNAQRRWQGWADPPLTEAGVLQARAAAARLTDIEFTTVVASPLQRARHTAELIARELGIDTVELRDDLRERSVGDWTGHTSDEIEERWPGMIAAWRRGELERLPGGELESDLADRVMGAVDELASRHGTLLVVTHGGVISLIARRVGADVRGLRNLCGYWLEPGLVPGAMVVVPEGEPTEITTTL